MNPVYFVGAGPGDPELLTLKGQRLLDQAEVIVYAGSLVNPALLTGLKAELHDSSRLELEALVGLMIKAQRQNRRVVRLHTGDPSLFGAIREQMDALDAAGVPWRVVPGVSSMAAAAAALGAELTLPEVAQTVIVTRRAGRTPVPESEGLASLARHQATMLIFLSVGMIEQVVAELRAGGYPADTPAAVVEKASWPEERCLRGTLEDIAVKVRAAGITKTALIAVGRALAESGPRVASRLYDREFSHACRRGRGTDNG